MRIRSATPAQSLAQSELTGKRLASRPRFTFLRSVSGRILRRVKTSRWHCCIRTTSGHSHLLLKITKSHHNHNHNHDDNGATQTTTVRFQKKMQLISLEIPEPGATRYQNLVRQNPLSDQKSCDTLLAALWGLQIGRITGTLSQCRCSLRS